MLFMKIRLFVFFYLSFVTNLVFSQARVENLKMYWPDEYKWKVGSDQENATMHLLELVPQNESIDDWKTLRTMQSLKGVTNMPMAKVPDLMFQQAQKAAPNAKLMVYEKNDQVKAPWIIFKIESPEFTGKPTTESQLFYVIQGQTALYINFVSIKKKTLSDEFTKKWIGVFKSSELVYK